MRILILFIAGASFALSAEETNDKDGDQSRKILGSSVVTSVSVIMDTGNGSKTVYTDAVGKPIPKPASASELASPINLLNPDRYEFYTFDDNGDLIKRLMSLEEIQGIIATGDSDGYDLDAFTSLGYLPEKRVNDVVNNVQSVLKEEMETHKNPPIIKPMFDTPDVSDSWSMILPAVFGNSGEDIKPEKPITHVTPDTIMIEPNMEQTYLISPSKANIPVSSTAKPIKQTQTSLKSTVRASTPRSTTTTLHISSVQPSVEYTPTQISTTDKITTLNTESTEKIRPLTPLTEKPLINVEIYSNSKSTENPMDQQASADSEYVEIKPLDANKDKLIPNYETQFATTKKPTTPEVILFSVDQSTFVESESKTTIDEIEEATKSPGTLTTPIPSSTSSSSSTSALNIKTTTKLVTPYTLLSTSHLVTPKPTTELTPILTNQTTESPLLTWRPIPIITEVTQEVPVSTRKPFPTTTDSIQEQTVKEYLSNNLPTLADLLNFNKFQIMVTEEPDSLITTSEDSSSSALTTYSAVNNGTNKEDTTIDIVMTPSVSEQSDDDLSTLSSEYFGTKNIPHTTQRIDQITQLPLEQSMDTAQKISASELLDQLLSTTNIGEINTELTNTEEQLFSNEDERFDITTQKNSRPSEVKPASNNATDEFIIKVMDNAETSTTLIDSIEQLLSQAVNNVEETLQSINDTEKIQNMLNGSVKRNMTDIQIESATLASTMIDMNFNTEKDEENEKDTSETSISETTAYDSGILSESVESLLSQIYDHNEPNMTTIEYDIPTEKYITSPPLNDETEPENEAFLTTENYAEIPDLDDEMTENDDKLFDEHEVTQRFETTTANYVALNTISQNDSDKNFESESHLINITIVSSDDTQNDNQNRSKPAKSDVSLELLLDEEIKKNVTLALNKDNITNIYNETTSSTIKDNESHDIEEEESDGIKTPNEILYTEETMSTIQNNTERNKENGEYDTNSTETNSPSEYFNDSSTWIDLYPEKVTITPTEESPEDESPSTSTTTDPFEPIKEISTINKRPATVIIIKRTKKPSTEETTLMNENHFTDVDVETTTVLNVNSEYTSYTNEEVGNTELLSTTTELTRDETTIDPTTENVKDVEPTIEVIISENNKPIHNDTSNITPSNSSVDNDEITDVSELNKESEGDENSRPQETSNIDIKIPSEEQPSPEVTDTPIVSDRPFNTEKESNNSENKPESTWTLVPTIAPHADEPIVQNYSPTVQHFPEIIEPPAPIDLVAKPLQGFGLEDSTSRLDTDIYQFAQLCNELAFGFWKTVTTGISSARSVFVSPFGATSLLAMVFLGARGATSGEMNEILRLDDMVTFNPHLIFKNVSESIKEDEPDSGVVSSAIIRELFSDRSKGKLLPFYKERAKAFYDGYVEEVSFREIGDVIRRRTSLQVKKYTNGKMTEFLKDSSVVARSPLAGVSVNIFQTDCSLASTDGRDGELHFVVHPSIRQRRLIPVPAVVYKSGFLAGYEPSVDATAVSLGTKDQTVSTILVIPGQQGIAAPGDGLARLEKRLVESSFKKGAWSRLLRSLIPRPGLEVQIPRFVHRSVINATVTLMRMGLHDLFDVDKADLRGLNGVANELYLSDMLQINSFATCGEKRIGDTHHSEIYPASAASSRIARHLENYQSENVHYRTDLLEEPRDYQRAFHDPLHDPSYLSLPLSQRPRQARVPETPRLKFDRPFIYFVRHNPTGLILHMGRFNPRLLP